MGCTQSKQTPRKKKSTISAAGKTQRAYHTLRKKYPENEDEKDSVEIINGRLSEREVHKRIISSEGTRSCQINDSVTIRYAHVSQRGFYPDDHYKPNQDALSITRNLGGVNRDAFLAVYDGHGDKGHMCSQFARKQLPSLMAKHVRRARFRQHQAECSKKGSKESAKYDPDNWPMLLSKQFEDCCVKAHVECNKLMHDDKSLDDKVSGTTAISAAFHTGKMTICNVGDSRAIMGKVFSPSDERNGVTKQPHSEHLQVVSLSHDQTPYRKDELLRVKKSGARVLSLDQVEGHEPIHENWKKLDLGIDIDEEGDPPRVWAQDGTYPGTAFTRSIGDTMADELGVFAEPEMESVNLTPDDKVIILASDGVFEFMTNQNVLDVCAHFTDPLEACHALVAESYEKWLEYEDRTDDITVVCMYIDTVGSDSLPLCLSKSDKTNSALSVATLERIEAQRAHRLRGSLKNSMQVVDKTNTQLRHIEEVISACAAFHNVSEHQRQLIVDAMKPISTKRGQCILQQGDAAECFYVVEEGAFCLQVLQGSDGSSDKNEQSVCTYEHPISTKSCDFFCEVSLVHSVPCAGTIVAQEDSKMWRLEASLYRKLRSEMSFQRLVYYKLCMLDETNHLSTKHIWSMVNRMEDVQYGAGESIVTQGNEIDAFFVVKAGVCECIAKNGTEAKEERTLCPFERQFFGEAVFLQQDCRVKATVVAVSAVICMRLDNNMIEHCTGNKNSTDATKSAESPPSIVQPKEAKK